MNQPFEVLPGHVAFVMDGNRRWARGLGKTPFQGHRAGLERSKEIIEENLRLGIRHMTLWGFSTENWKRSRREVDYLMRLFERYIASHLDALHDKKIRLRHIGRKDRLPKTLMKLLRNAEERTANNTALTLQLALDYGGRDEIIRAVEKLLRQRKKITEEAIDRALDTHDVPDPDLIIRTSGEVRLSGFLAWQGVYSELYFTAKCFPDFDIVEYHKALREYSRRIRNFGG